MTYTVHHSLEFVDLIKAQAVEARGWLTLIDVSLTEPASVSRRTNAGEVVEQVLTGGALSTGICCTLINVNITHLTWKWCIPLKKLLKRTIVFLKTSPLQKIKKGFWNTGYMNKNGAWPTCVARHTKALEGIYEVNTCSIILAGIRVTLIDVHLTLNSWEAQWTAAVKAIELVRASAIVETWLTLTLIDLCLTLLPWRTHTIYWIGKQQISNHDHLLFSQQSKIKGKVTWE